VEGLNINPVLMQSKAMRDALLHVRSVSLLPSHAHLCSSTAESQQRSRLPWPTLKLNKQRMVSVQWLSLTQ
jgi:hypothetical protein